ncbi:MAG: family 10 glycosylhydrolase [Planctomycetaceae bacterium]
MRTSRSSARRILVLIIASTWLSSDAAETTSPKPYRVIFNCDGHAVAKDANGDLDQWIENLFGPLTDSHVDALFWCDGAGGNTANYDSRVLERTGVRAGKPRTYIDRWIDEGNDPPLIVVREAKKRNLDVYYSFRINDIHDSFMPDEMPTFKTEHPEWMIGERDYGGVTSFKSALNFAVPEVRELKFRVIEELFNQYDFDGLEIDFLRSSPYFLPGTESTNAHLLTELLQRTRFHLNERGKQRDRPVWLAVRVNESLKSCALDGYDVSAWIRQGLVDIVTLGSGVMDIEVEEFKQIAANSRTRIYPCLYGWPSKYSPIPAELAAGLATNYHAQGADGIYLFNWFPHTNNNSEATGNYMTGLMKLLGDPSDLLRGQQQLMFAADRGRPERSYQYNWLHCVLPAALPTNEPLTVPMRVFAEFPEAATLTVQLHIQNLEDDDDVTVHLNGKPVRGWSCGNPQRLDAEISAQQLQFGVNQFELRLAERRAGAPTPRMVTAIELHVTQR